MNEEKWSDEPLLPIPVDLNDENLSLSSDLDSEESILSDKNGMYLKKDILYNKKKESDNYNDLNNMGKESMVSVFNKNNSVYFKAKHVPKNVKKPANSESFLKQSPMSSSTPLCQRLPKKRRRSPTTLDDTTIIPKISRILRPRSHKNKSVTENKISPSVQNKVTTKNKTLRRRSETLESLNTVNYFDQVGSLPGSSDFTESEYLFLNDDNHLTKKKVESIGESKDFFLSEKSESTSSGSEVQYNIKSMNSIKNKNYCKRLRSYSHRENLSSKEQIQEKTNRSKFKNIENFDILENKCNINENLNNIQGSLKKGTITFQYLLNVFQETQKQKQLEKTHLNCDEKVVKCAKDSEGSISKTVMSNKKSEAVDQNVLNCTNLPLNKNVNNLHELSNNYKTPVKFRDTKSCNVSKTPENFGRLASAEDNISKILDLGSDYLGLKNSVNAKQNNNEKINKSCDDQTCGDTVISSSDEFSESDSDVKYNLKKYKSNVNKSYSQVLRSASKKEKNLITPIENKVCDKIYKEVKSCSPKLDEFSKNDFNLTQDSRNEKDHRKSSQVKNKFSVDVSNSEANVPQENNHPQNFESNTISKIQSMPKLFLDNHPKISPKKLIFEQNNCNYSSSCDELGDLVIDEDDFICNPSKKIIEKKLTKKLEYSKIKEPVNTKFHTKVNLTYISKPQSLSDISAGPKSEMKEQTSNYLKFIGDCRTSTQKDQNIQPFNDWIMRGTPFVLNNLIKPIHSAYLSYDSWILKESQLKAILPLKKAKVNLLCHKNSNIIENNFFTSHDSLHKKSLKVSKLLNNDALSVFKKYIHPLKLKKIPNNLIKSYVYDNISIKNRLNSEKNVVTSRINGVPYVAIDGFVCGYTKNYENFEANTNNDIVKNASLHKNASRKPNCYSKNSLKSVPKSINKSKTEHNSSITGKDYISEVDNFNKFDSITTTMILSKSHKEKTKVDSEMAVLPDNFPCPSFGCNVSTPNSSQLMTNFAKENEIIKIEVSRCIEDLIEKIERRKPNTNNVFFNKPSQELLKYLSSKTKTNESFTAIKKNNEDAKVLLLNPKSIRKKVKPKRNKTPVLLRHKLSDLKRRNLMVGIPSTQESKNINECVTDGLLCPKIEIDCFNIKNSEHFGNHVLSLEKPIRSYEEFLKLRKQQKHNKKLRKVRKSSEEENVVQLPNKYQVSNDTIDTKCFENKPLLLEKSYLLDPERSSNHSSTNSFKKRRKIVLPTVNDKNALSEPSTTQQGISASHFKPFIYES